MESGFLCGFNGLQLVHSMLLVEHDNLPLGLAHNGCVMCCRLGFLCFGSTKGEDHGGDLQIVRYVLFGFIRLHIGLV